MNQELEETSQIRQRKTTTKDPSDLKTPQVVEIAEPSATFFIVKSLLILIVFFILHTLWQAYIFNPIFRPERSVDYDTITSKICPPNSESCSFQLKENWKNIIKQAHEKR